MQQYQQILKNTLIYYNTLSYQISKLCFLLNIILQYLHKGRYCVNKIRSTLYKICFIA